MEDWTALVVHPAKDYLAQIELQRLGLSPYMAQAKRRFTPPRGAVPRMRRYPLFPGYLLIRITEAANPVLAEARGLRGYRPVLGDINGVPWRAPHHVIEALRVAEAKGSFDEAALGCGDKVTWRKGIFAGVEAVVGRSQAAKTFELLVPLFGSHVRATVSQASMVRF